MKREKEKERGDRTTQAKEMASASAAAAKEDRRQPVCVHCGHSLDKVSETKYELISWTWNAEKGGYFQDVVGDSDGPYHDCSKCPDRCRRHDPDFADNDLIYY